MAFISKAPRDIKITRNTATGCNIAPGAYDFYGSSKKSSVLSTAFGTTTKRNVGEMESTDIEGIEQTIISRQNFEYESEIIKKYLRKPMPVASFDSRLRRIPMSRTSTIPDPGKYYEDPIRRKVQILKDQGENSRKIQQRSQMIKKSQESIHTKPNLPSIPGRNEQFGYTYMDRLSRKAIRNFNPNMLDGSKDECVGPGEYDPEPIGLTKHIGSPKMTKTGSIGNRKRNPVVETATGAYIGPGSYDPHFMIPNYKFKPSANFLYSGPKSGMDAEMKSKTVLKPNPDSENDSDLIAVPSPGPGHYYSAVKHTGFKMKPKNFKFQLFNSSMPRFEDNSDNIFVGPGSYHTQPKGHIRSKSTNPHNIGFGAEAPRDGVLSPTKDFPGPGAYAYPYELAKVSQKKHKNTFGRRRRHRSDILNNLSQQVSAQSGIYNELNDNITQVDMKALNRDSDHTTDDFSSKVQGSVSMIDHRSNFAKEKSNLEANRSFDPSSPGPGQYHGAHDNPRFKRKNADWIFSSGLNRFEKAEEDEIVPHVGEYEISAFDISRSKKNLKKNHAGFNVGANRFRSKSPREAEPEE